jgi:hypothetical protein
MPGWPSAKPGVNVAGSTAIKAGNDEGQREETLPAGPCTVHHRQKLERIPSIAQMQKHKGPKAYDAFGPVFPESTTS